VSAFQASLIAALVGIAVIHTYSRLGGALATAGWCVAAAVYGWHEFSTREGGLVFVGVATPQWLYFVSVAGVFVFHAVMAIRGLTRKVAGPAAPKAPPPPAAP
jgi:hypothetical protein